MTSAGYTRPGHRPAAGIRHGQLEYRGRRESLRYAGIIANNGAGSGSLAGPGHRLRGTSRAPHFYSGDTVLTGATLISGNTAAIPSGAGKGEPVDNGFLDLHGVGATVNGFSGSGRVTNSQAGSTASFNVGSTIAPHFFSGVIQDAGAGSSAGQDRQRLLPRSPASIPTPAARRSLPDKMPVTGSLTATSGEALQAANASFYQNGYGELFLEFHGPGHPRAAAPWGIVAINNGGTLPGAAAPRACSTWVLDLLQRGSCVSMDIGSTMGGAGLDRDPAPGPINLGGATPQLSPTDGYRRLSGSRYLLAYTKFGGLISASFSGLTSRETLDVDQRHGELSASSTSTSTRTTTETAATTSLPLHGRHEETIELGGCDRRNSFARQLNSAVTLLSSAATGVRYTNVTEQGDE